MNDEPCHVCVIGAGTMGRGIAQTALSAGHLVSLVDPDRAQLDSARADIVARLRKRNPRAGDDAARLLGTYTAIETAPPRQATVVIEAVLEDLEVKHAVLRAAAVHFGETCVLATNTSSLSVTAIAAGMPDPSRTVGMHFFNPVPVMRLVEVVRGLQTDEDVAETITRLAERWGKSVAHAKSTPGFIVNRVARGFYGEALRLLEEGSAAPETLDEIVRGCGGFRMGPFELMDLIGNDVNSAVTRSIWSAYNFDPRFAPSHVQAELVVAGRLGRKTMRGFYEYGEGSSRSTPTPVDAPAGQPKGTVVLHGQSAQLETMLKRSGMPFDSQPSEGQARLELVGVGTVVLTRGLTARQESHNLGTPTLVLDLSLDPAGVSSIAVACHDESLVEAAAALLASAGVRVHRVADLPGLVLARILAVIANEAWETAHHGVATPDDIDVAMQLGTNYPMGPFAWTTLWSPRLVLALLDALADTYRDPRYRASVGLRIAVD